MHCPNLIFSIGRAALQALEKYMLVSVAKSGKILKKQEIIQFPLGKPLPTKLIEKIVRFRVKENLNKLK